MCLLLSSRSSVIVSTNWYGGMHYILTWQVWGCTSSYRGHLHGAWNGHVYVSLQFVTCRIWQRRTVSYLLSCSLHCVKNELWIFPHIRCVEKIVPIELSTIREPRQAPFAKSLLSTKVLHFMNNLLPNHACTAFKGWMCTCVRLDENLPNCNQISEGPIFGILSPVHTLNDPKIILKILQSTKNRGNLTTDEYFSYNYAHGNYYTLSISKHISMTSVCICSVILLWSGCNNSSSKITNQSIA